MTDVTIVVATYNRPAWLEVELESILASAATVKHRVRVLVVDDASETRAARDICKRLGVDYHRMPENGGVARTLAAGFERVDSTYYALWGDDDFMLPNWFPLHLDRIEQGYDVVSGSYWRADADLRPVKRQVLAPVTFADLMAGRVSANDGSLVRRDSLGDITYRPDRERAMLMTFWLAMAASGRRFSTIEEPTWLYRRHDSNMSRQLTEHDRSLREAAVAEYAA